MSIYSMGASLDRVWWHHKKAKRRKMEQEGQNGWLLSLQSREIKPMWLMPQFCWGLIFLIGTEESCCVHILSVSRNLSLTASILRARAYSWCFLGLRFDFTEFPRHCTRVCALFCEPVFFCCKCGLVLWSWNEYLVARSVNEKQIQLRLWHKQIWNHKQSELLGWCV